MIAWPTRAHAVVRARIAAHRAADEIVQGYGWKDGRGCAIGCSLDAYNHAEYARVLGVDERVAHLVDAIHEGLPRDLALDWPGRVAAALRPGADTTQVADRWLLWLLTEELGAYPTSAPVAALYRRRLAGDEPAGKEWDAARAAARAAAWSRMAAALERILRECPMAEDER